jgi:hypothetical protein
MKALCISLLLAVLVSPCLSPAQSPDDSPINVLSFKWSKIHQTTSTGPDKPLPARAVSPNDKNFERNNRINDPAGTRDPSADTLDMRGQDLEKSVRSANSSPTKSADSFVYQAKIHNTSKSVIEIVFWEYQLIDTANPANVTRRQFLCGINLKPDKDRDVQALSSLGPNTVNAATAAGGNQVQEKAIINRVEFADGKSWMRKDWNAAEIKDTYKRAMATPWSPNEMCRAL